MTFLLFFAPPPPTSPDTPCPSGSILFRDSCVTISTDVTKTSPFSSHNCGSAARFVHAFAGPMMEAKFAGVSAGAVWGGKRGDKCLLASGQEAASCNEDLRSMCGVKSEWQNLRREKRAVLQVGSK